MDFNNSSKITIEEFEKLAPDTNWTDKEIEEVIDSLDILATICIDATEE